MPCSTSCRVLCSVGVSENIVVVVCCCCHIIVINQAIRDLHPINSTQTPFTAQQQARRSLTRCPGLDCACCCFRHFEARARRRHHSTQTTQISTAPAAPVNHVLVCAYAVAATSASSRAAWSMMTTWRLKRGAKREPNQINGVCMYFSARRAGARASLHVLRRVLLGVRVVGRLY